MAGIFPAHDFASRTAGARFSMLDFNGYFPQPRSLTLCAPRRYFYNSQLTEQQRAGRSFL